MQTRYFALILGLAFLLIGVLGFVPALGGSPNMEHGHLLGLFPVNAVHNLAHIVFGIWGVAAWRRWESARFYARGVAVLYGVLAIAGLIPRLDTVFGLMPIHGNDVWLHAVIAIASAIFGFAPVGAHDHAVASVTHDTAVSH